MIKYLLNHKHILILQNLKNIINLILRSTNNTISTINYQVITIAIIQQSIMMSQSKVIKCPAGSEASKVCCHCNCYQLPFICDNKQCQCQKHQECQSILLKGINKRLMAKGQSLLPLYQILAQWYQSYIKEFTIRLEEIRSKIQMEKLILIKDEAKLYKLLNETNGDEVDSYLVYKALLDLQTQPKYDLNQKMLYLKKKLDERSVEMNSILLRIKDYANAQQLVTQNLKYKMQFSSYFHHHQIELKSKNSIIKVKTFMSNHLTTLCQHSVDKFGNKKQTYRFQVIRTQRGYIKFGLCYLQSALKNNYIGVYNNGNGGYLIEGSNGNFQLDDDQKPTRGNDKITNINTFDTFQMTYNPCDGKLQFRNVTKKQRDSIVVKSKTNNPLYACVIMCDPEDSVQCLGVVIQE